MPSTSQKILISDEIDSTHYLGRAIESNIILRDEDGKLSASAIDLKRIPGFSTNKIPSSKPIDLKISFPKETRNNYLDSWTEGLNGVTPIKSHFNIDHSKELYFIKIDDINGFVGKYQNPQNVPTNYDFKLKIIHSPLLSNYWHFEFHVDSEHGEVDSSKSWRKLVCSSIRTQIQEFAVFKI